MYFSDSTLGLLQPDRVLLRITSVGIDVNLGKWERDCACFDSMIKNGATSLLLHNHDNKMKSVRPVENCIRI